MKNKTDVIENKLSKVFNNPIILIVRLKMNPVINKILTSFYWQVILVNFLKIF
jgi:hypothetical protein